MHKLLLKGLFGERVGPGVYWSVQKVRGRIAYDFVSVFSLREAAPVPNLPPCLLSALLLFNEDTQPL